MNMSWVLSLIHSAHVLYCCRRSARDENRTVCACCGHIYIYLESINLNLFTKRRSHVPLWNCKTRWKRRLRLHNERIPCLFWMDQSTMALCISRWARSFPSPLFFHQTQPERLAAAHVQFLFESLRDRLMLIVLSLSVLCSILHRAFWLLPFENHLQRIMRLGSRANIGKRWMRWLRHHSNETLIWLPTNLLSDQRAGSNAMPFVWCEAAKYGIINALNAAVWH